MKSLHIRELNGGYVLVEREYLAQGLSPSYATLCRLSPMEAACLSRTRLIPMWFAAHPECASADASELLSLHEPHEGHLEIRLRLPADGQRRAMDIAVPGYDSVLRLAAADPTKRANLVRNTGIRDASSARANPAAA